MADNAAARAVAAGGANRPSSPGLSSAPSAKPLVTNNPTSSAPAKPITRPPYTGLSGPATARPGVNGGPSAPNWPEPGAPPAGSSSYAPYTGSPAAAPATASPSAGPRVDVTEHRPQLSPPVDVPDPFTPRVARLTVASVDPWSALKLSFLLSVAAGIALVIASIVLWLVLSGIGVFDQLNNVLGDLGMNTTTKQFNIYDYIGFGRVVSLSIVIGVINTLLLTALATITAFLYNLSAGLVGGIRVTLSDD